ncbi:MAG: DUF4097 family beta strand repeat-containing protein [Paenisporosarcina sp.]
MQQERKRILDLVERGSISAQEALVLLEALENGVAKPNEPKQDANREPGKTTHSTNSNTEEHTKKSTSSQADDFMEDIKRDFTQFGDRFMHFMQSAVGKMKSFDFDMPFGEPVEFHHTFSKELMDFKDISVDLANGKIEIYPSQDSQVRAECHVRVYRSQSIEVAKAEFLEKFIFVIDQNKLRILSDMKTTHVNVVLYVPKQTYSSISTRLFNGGFTGKHIEVDRLKIKTANGKVDLKNIHIEEAEIQTANGTIHVHEATGNKIDAETMNGRVYIDGHLKEIEGQSVNGHVVVTTRDKNARKIEGSAVAGAVEIYVPSTIAIKGEVSSNLGKIDVALSDVTQISEQEHFLQKSIRFSKEIADSTATPLYIKGEAKTGSVLVRYITAE